MRESEKDRDEKERNAEMRERDENSAFSRNSSMPLDPIFRSARVQYTWIDAPAPFLRWHFPRWESCGCFEVYKAPLVAFT